MSLIDRALRMGEAKKFKGYEQRVAKINALEPEYEAMSDEELREAADELRERARGEDPEPLEDLLYDCFAMVREAGRRTMGMRHFDVQLIGGMVLHDGNIAEMRTGEGKTLTGTLPAILNSLAGKGVHVVTVNDYLARRDCEWMSPIYDALGVTYGVLQNMQPAEEKRAAYAADLTYGTNSEFGFDYLRDNMAGSLEDKVQHGGRDLGEVRTAKDRLERRSAAHTFAIVDEVDNILIDEARTPLIISGAPEEAGELYARFARLAPMLTPGRRPEGMDPKTKKEFVADYDFEFDEKHRTVAITERGVEKAERFLGIDHLYRAENGHLVNHLIQSLRAQALYRRDVDYAVIDGEVAIIDEFTGRILEGRRWSEGLHQAIEAKEGVNVTEENQTMATVTYQNYFRLYDKLSGMTGTGITEATEFMKIYRLGVVQIPTNRPMIRKDQNDQVFKTKEGKWQAVVDEIVERNARGQPILVGTISVEVSEDLGARLAKRGVPHIVLNAKPEHAEKEGETVAEAGRSGAVTIATNMAGRGVDIKLGGNPEHLAARELVKLGLTPEDPDYDEHYAKVLPEIERRVDEDREKVLEAGGLYIIGTERHESRRIDNQLRGRSGRQGDPGETRFYLSAEDDLVRLFAGERIYKILDRFGTTDDEGKEEPIEAGLLSKQIEKAQKKVEEQNFLIRKRVLDYDDVMNEQRRIVYAYRDEVLEGRDMGDEARDQINQMLERTIDESCPGDYIEDWDVEGLFARVAEIFPLSFSQDDLNPDSIERGELHRLFTEEATARYDERERELGDELMRVLERYLLLQIIDQRWQEHLYDMDYLREGIHLRGFAQIEPLVAYKNEGFTLFQDLMNTIWADFARMVFNVEVQIDTGEEEPPAPQDVIPQSTTSNSSWTSGGFTYSGSASSTMAPYSAMTTDPDAAALAIGADQPEAEEDDGSPRIEQRRVDAIDQIGRNDPCWCGSGKKFKKCHGT
ncbi:preprotein translocase subunit SecA [Conexibacter stalactiti]|uniref:Protein translocase subunit SecA n=1 Tax=Conexibacter stalactiti TaxID=1940611 RepID=A0ABU4HZN6_9ACTN|nr:preprotein translocase subunit SecA [Conexibacter stalactiti]MDW5598782.1 preprotein translocase subunit SecA [Conexibacter stalactiti]MEC5039424.1 preprotein translocase subunit SecA [Conexibacter stalactiti]